MLHVGLGSSDSRFWKASPSFSRRLCHNTVQPAAAPGLQEELGRTSTGTIEMNGRSRRLVPPPAPVTLLQVEEGSATATATEREEERRKAEAKERIEAGGAAAIFGFSVLSGCLCLAKRASNARFSLCLFLAFATFLCGNALMMLSINMLGLRADLVSGDQNVSAKCLLVACATLSVLTVLSLVALLRRRLYQYISLAVLTVIVLPAGGAHCYLRRGTDGGSEAAPAYYDEHKEELDAAAKITFSVTNSAFGGLVGVLFSVSMISRAAADSIDMAAYAAIFFMFSTAIIGMFVMMVSKKVPEITSPRFRRLLITVIRLANVFLLCLLACAAFAAAFVVLRYRVFAAFAPLVITAILCFLLRYCVFRRGRTGGATRREDHEWLKVIEDHASNVTMAMFGGIMSVLGASIGEKDNSKAGKTGVFMVMLTSAFVSGFGFMLLAAAPGSARACLAPAAKVLVWSSVALFAAKYTIMIV